VYDGVKERRILSNRKMNQRLTRGHQKDAPMKKSTVISLAERAQVDAKSHLKKLLREGARKLLQAAIESEVAEYLENNQDRRTEGGKRAVVRNGYHPERELVTGIGPIKIEQPRVRHRGGKSLAARFCHPICAVFPASMF
jgi:putative transposase